MSQKYNRSSQQLQRLVERHAGSGLSITAYCRKHRIPLSSFYYQRRKIQQPAAQKHNSLTSKPPSFIPVEVETESAAASSESIMTVTFPSGLTIEVPGTQSLMREICVSLLRTHGLA